MCILNVHAIHVATTFYIVYECGLREEMLTYKGFVVVALTLLRFNSLNSHFSTLLISNPANLQLPGYANIVVLRLEFPQGLELKNLEDSKECHSLCSPNCFNILDHASTSFQRKSEQ